MTLEGAVALVTGASAGIGRAYVEALTGEGAHVVAVARSFPVTAPRPGTPDRRPCDVTDESAVEALVRDVAGDHGRIDVLVNNAGIYPRAETLATTGELWDEVMRVNVRGAFVVARECLKIMVGQGSGSIVNLTSRVGQTPAPEQPEYDHFLAYAASKAAVDRMTTFLAGEFAPHGIAVNALSPGTVLTDTFVAGAGPEAMERMRATHGKVPTAEVMGPPLLHLAGQAPPSFLTGRIVHHDEFGITWPEQSVLH